MTEGPAQGTGSPDPEDARMAMAHTRRGFVGAALASLVSALVVALLWLLARGAPSAGRDPNLTRPMRLPTRTPTPVTPASATPRPTAAG